jgi:Fe-S cluster assembly protein SufD
MSQATSTQDRYLAAFEHAFDDGDAAWVRELRRQALDRFSHLGFPTVRRGNEAWKYTNVAPIASGVFDYDDAMDDSGVDLASIAKRVPWDEDWPRLLFVNGRYSKSLSSLPIASTGGGPRLANLAEVIDSDSVVAEPHLARLASFDDDGFTALNTAFIRDGAFIHLPDDTSLKNPVHVVFVATARPEPTVSHGRSLILAGRNSRLQVIESFINLTDKPYFTNAVTEIVAGEGSSIEHHKVQLEGPTAFHVGTIQVRQAKDSVFTSTSVAAGGALARTNLTVLLDGPGSSCTLNGLSFTSGSQHVDNNTSIDHLQPRTTSRQNYKSILDDNSRAVFGGRVRVLEQATKADAVQTDKNLLLSKGAEADTKPSLEIYTDDVKASHGATAGRLDENAMFYLMSRGLDDESARGILVSAFAAEIIDTVSIKPLHSFLSTLFSRAVSEKRA